MKYHREVGHPHISQNIMSYVSKKDYINILEKIVYVFSTVQIEQAIWASCGKL